MSAVPTWRPIAGAHGTGSVHDHADVASPSVGALPRTMRISAFTRLPNHIARHSSDPPAPTSSVPPPPPSEANVRSKLRHRICGFENMTGAPARSVNVAAATLLAYRRLPSGRVVHWLPM